MHFQSVVMNVADLDRSVEFYRDVFGFTLLSQHDQLAAVHGGTERPQVIIFRALGTSSSRVGGARHIGIRALVLEVESLEEVDRIAAELDRRHSLAAKRGSETWMAAFGRDPDRIAVVAGCSLTPEPISLDSWADLDESLYSLGE